MSALANEERRIVGFLCNWCSYGGADTAGVARANQPTDLRIIRVPCSGRVNPLFVVKALLNGADGVLVSGCHPRDCHYGSGNFYARRRLEVLKRFLPILGIDPQRFSYTWVSASEGSRWQQVVTRFTEEIHALEPAPRFEDVEPLEKALTLTQEKHRPLGVGKQDWLAKLKEAISDKLADLDCVLGWQQGRDLLHSVPLFIQSADDLQKLRCDATCHNNLVRYLPDFKGRKVGIIVRGCEAKSLVQLLQEGIINREELVIFALPCQGLLDLPLVEEALGRYQKLEGLEITDSALKLRVDGKDVTLATADYLQSRCLSCPNDTPVLADYPIGEFTGESATTAQCPELAFLDSLSLTERLGFWRACLSRCILCHACRNSCPMCVCRDQCIAESREPHWQSAKASVKEKFFFQIIHALHLAGRCTGCGQCQANCPMGIPIFALRAHLNRVISELFDGYQAGLDPKAVPPLLTYAQEEANIQERSWE
ncbi:MAG: hydrogenase iron-sulfur subunit [Desulfovibrio sp.]|nr:hydrogenase iron-sulfur subunit [Desulfovibrio sp.]